MSDNIRIHNDIAYRVIIQIPLHRFAKTIDAAIDMNLVKQYRDALGADHVLQTPTHYMFCETIPDVEFEEIIE
jgi:hypothetical protein